MKKSKQTRRIYRSIRT